MNLSSPSSSYAKCEAAWAHTSPSLRPAAPPCCSGGGTYSSSPAGSMDHLLSNMFQSQWNKFNWQVVVPLARNGLEKLIEAAQSWGLGSQNGLSVVKNTRLTLASTAEEKPGNSLSTPEKRAPYNVPLKTLVLKGSSVSPDSNRSTYSTVTSWQQETLNAKPARDRKWVWILAKQTDLQLLPDHKKNPKHQNVVASATHSVPRARAEAADGWYQIQSQTQSLAHTLCSPSAYKRFLNSDDTNLYDIITLSCWN